MAADDSGPRELCKPVAPATVYAFPMPVHHKDPCPCGSGKRYKHCCLPREGARRQRTLTFAGLGFLAVVTGAGLVLARRGDQARDTAPASAPLPGGSGGSPFGTQTPGT